MAKLSKEAREFKARRKTKTFELNALGFEDHLIPRKHFKMSYKGVLISEPETWNNWDKKNGLTVFTSEALSILLGTDFVSVDIDYPQALDPVLLEMLKENPTFMVWHGEKSPLEGGKGAFIYKTSSEHKTYKKYKRSLVRTDKRLLTHGYEILRGWTSQMCYGIHHGTEWYEHNGKETVQLPDCIYQYLKDGDELRKPRKKSDTTVKLSGDSKDIDKFLFEVTKLCKARGINLTSLEPVEIRVDETCLFKAMGFDDDSHSFALYINKDGTVIARTNQPNFQMKLPTMTELSCLPLPVKINGQLEKPKKKLRKAKKRKPKEQKPLKKVGRHKRKKAEAPVNYESLKSLFHSSRLVGISAGTGAGKSFTSRESILDWLSQSEENKAIYFTSDNKNAKAMKDNFPPDDPEVFQMSGDTSGEWAKYKKQTRLVITNQQYIARKSIADKNHYAIMEWIDGNTMVIIDEADMLFNTMKFEQPLMFRYDATSFEGMEDYEPIHTLRKCPSTVMKTYKCETCDLCKKMAVRKPLRGRYAKVEQFVDTGLYRRDFDTQSGWLDVASDMYRGDKLGEEVELHNSKQISLKARQVTMQSDTYMNNRPLTCKIEVSPFDSLEDLLRCSHDAFLMTNDFPEELVRRKRDKIFQRFKNQSNPVAKTNKELKKWMAEKGIRFPYYVCNVPVLKGFDMSGLRTIANRAASVVLLSATYSLQQVEYFNDALPGIKWRQYTGTTFKAIQDLLIITTDEDFGEGGGQFRFSKELRDPDGQKIMLADIMTRHSMEYLDPLARDGDLVEFAGRTLMVQPASYLGNSIELSRLLTRDRNRVENFKSGQYSAMRSFDNVVPNTITYSKSALARGMNLGDYDRCITEGEAFQPADSYNWQSDGSRELTKLQTEEKVRLLLQSIGRIMRAPVIYKDGHANEEPILRRKVITIYNCGAGFGKHVAERLGALCVNPPKTVHVPIFWEGQEVFPALNSYDAVDRVLKHEHHWLTKGFISIDDFCHYHSESELMKRPWSRLPAETQRRIGTKEQYDNLRATLKASEV